MKKRLIKYGLSAALLLGLANNANSGILYSQKQVKQNVKLEQVFKKIKQKYPKKNLEYFSRGFLQFKEQRFVQDSEIDRLIQNSFLTDEEKKDPNNLIDGANFHSDYTIMIDDKSHHIGDGKKDWMPIPEPEGTFYERKFVIKDKLKNPRLGMEVFSSDSDNKIYINNKFVGLVPRMSKKNWGKLMKKYKQKTPFIYGELPILKYLKQGENIIRIESKKSGIIFKSYDDFLMKRVQIVYDKNERQKDN